MVSGLNIVAVGAVVKHVGSEVPSAQAGFLRYLLGLVFITPMLIPLLRTRLNRHSLILFGWRGIVHGFGVLLWFYSITRITITEVVSLMYLAPICITLGAFVFLGEKLAYRRVLAVLAALCGTLIILRPGFREISAGHLAVLAAAVFFASSYLITKRLTEQFDAPVIVGMLSLVVPLVLLPFALADWVMPTTAQLGWLFLTAAFATAAHYTMTLSLLRAPISATQPVVFLQLVWSAVIGLVLFGEATDVWVLTGGAVIVASVSFIAWREAALAIKRRNGSSVTLR